MCVFLGYNSFMIHVVKRMIYFVELQAIPWREVGNVSPVPRLVLKRFN